MKQIIKSEVIEIKIPAGAASNRFLFAENQQLRDAKIVGLVIQSGMAKTMQGTVTLATDKIKEGYLVIYINGREDIKLPLASLVKEFPAQNDKYGLPFAGQQIEWTKSYIQFPDATTAQNAEPRAVEFTVFY